MPSNWSRLYDAIQKKKKKSKFIGLTNTATKSKRIRERRERGEFLPPPNTLPFHLQVLCPCRRLWCTPCPRSAKRTAWLRGRWTPRMKPPSSHYGGSLTLCYPRAPVPPDSHSEHPPAQTPSVRRRLWPFRPPMSNPLIPRADRPQLGWRKPFGTVTGKARRTACLVEELRSKRVRWVVRTGLARSLRVPGWWTVVVGLRSVGAWTLLFVQR